ncbi:hypothetical protein ABFA07_002570 [Porites harrisoni]
MRLLIGLLFVCFLSPLESQHPPGHLQPLGSHQPPSGSIESSEVVPGPREFFEENVRPGKPLLLRGAAKSMPAYSKWTDGYLSERFGEVGIDVEEGKKENRSLATFHFKLQDFISRYKNEDIYMVESLPLKMREEYALLKSLRCGGYTEVLQDAVVWFSSGGTKSVLHFDSVDNINCLFDGTKELLMINKSYLEQAHIDKVEGAFSTVDVDSVDMYKFPGLQTIPYYKVLMEPGDCLFIPSRWIHQVRSYGSRNLAVNIWWAHFTNFNHTDCEVSPHKDKELVPLSLFDFHPGEAIRQAALEVTGGKTVTLQEWTKLMEANYPGVVIKELLEQNFNEIDGNKDGFVSPEEIQEIKYEDLQRLLDGPADEEEEEEEAIDPSELPEEEEEKSQTEDLADEDEKTDATHTEL